jgi:hypothetical protein
VVALLDDRRKNLLISICGLMVQAASINMNKRRDFILDRRRSEAATHFTNIRPYNHVRYCPSGLCLSDAWQHCNRILDNDNAMHPLPLIILTLLILLSACTNREFTRTPRTGTEQLLLSHAIQQSVKDVVLPIPAASAVMVEVVGFTGDRQWLQPSFLADSPMINTHSTGGDNSSSTESNLSAVRPHGSDLAVLRGFVEGRFAELGCTLAADRDRVDLWIRVMVLAIGTDQGQSFFGMPPVQSALIPFSLPALTLYQSQRQIAYVRYLVQVYDARTRRLLFFSPWYQGSSYYNQYTVLLFINFRGTDLIEAPYLQ